MQISILKGIYTDSSANWRASYPYNLEPVIADSGVSKGYLRLAPGLTFIGTTAKPDRGAIFWRNRCIRIMGNTVYSVFGNTIDSFGVVSSGPEPVWLDYSFDRLAIGTDFDLFYLFLDDTIVQVTDPDLGNIIDGMWIDGYFFMTDGEFLVVTELADPMSVNPLKYGSSEEDPDPVVGVIKFRGEAYALNRYTIENFQNIGGAGFPFQRNAAGLIPKGLVGKSAKALFLDSFAFVGGGRNEAISIWLAGLGTASRISTPQIDRLLGELSDAQQAQIEIETVVQHAEERLFIHLPTVTCVYSHQASLIAGEPVWHFLSSSNTFTAPYLVRHFALESGRFVGGNADGEIGYMDEGQPRVFGDTVPWQFDTQFSYNSGKGAIVKSLELVAAAGRGGSGNPTVSMALTFDGINYSADTDIPMGVDNTRQRMQWRPARRFENFMGARFSSQNTVIPSFARLEGEFEALSG